MSTEAIQVTTLGFDDRSINILGEAFQRKMQGACVVSTPEKAKVVLVNLDAQKISQQYDEFSSKYNIPAVGLGKKEKYELNIKKIQIPVSNERLTEVIMKVAEPAISPKLNKITEDKIAQAMAAIDSRKIAKSLDNRITDEKPKSSAHRAVPKKNDEMCFDEERFLLGHLIEARNKIKGKGQVAVINCHGSKTILINDSQAEIQTDLTDNQIRALAIAPSNDSLSSPITIDYHDLSELISLDLFTGKSPRNISLEVFMWDLGLMTSRGRLPMSIDTTERQYIMRWPNLTRMRLADNTIQIIAYWIKQPCNLYDMNEKTGVPLQDIFSVFTAAYAAGLASAAKRQSDHLLSAEEIMVNPKRGLFNSIVTRLRKFNKEAA